MASFTTRRPLTGAHQNRGNSDRQYYSLPGPASHMQKRAFPFVDRHRQLYHPSQRTERFIDEIGNASATASKIACRSSSLIHAFRNFGR